MNYAKLAKIIITTLSTIALLWVVASVIDVNLHNMSDHAYAWWNLFNMFFGE